VRKALLKCHRNLKVSPNKSAKEQLQMLASQKLERQSKQCRSRAAYDTTLMECISMPMATIHVVALHMMRRLPLQFVHKSTI